MKKSMVFIYSLLMVYNFSNAQRSGGFPLTKTRDGYQIDLGESVLDPVAAKNVKVDVALVDLSSLAKARTSKDSTDTYARIYKDPSLFSIVTGNLQYISGSTAKLITDAKFKFGITDPRFTMVIVENNGTDNSGANVAPQAFYRRNPRCPCTSCGCCCYRTPRGCTYCGIKVTK